MLDSLAILAQLFGVMAALVVLGEPLRLFFGKFSAFLRNLDFVETIVLDVYFGGFILYLVALPPLHLFDFPVILGLFVICALISFVYYYRLMRGGHFAIRHLTELPRRGKMVEQAFILSMFVVALCLQVFPLTSIFYGSVHDVSLHSLLVQVILENKYIPYNLEPYLPEGIIYPQASHVIFAFASYMIGWVAPQAVCYVTQLFSALTVLGAYFLARRLWQSRTFYLGVVFVFTFVAAWPMFITWGANPFVAGFALFLVSLGVLFSLLFNSTKEGKIELVIIGILFGYLGALIISFLQTLMAIAMIAVLILFFLRSPKIRQLSWNLIILFAVSFIPLSTFLYRFVSYYPYPGHNIGLPADFAGYPRVQHWLTQGFQWTFENLSPYFVLSVEMTLVCIVGAVLFLKVEWDSGLKWAFAAASLIFVASVSLGLISYILPADFNVISWGHQGIILVISISLFLAVFNHSLFRFLRGTVSKLLPTNFNKPSSVLLITILTLSALYAPFVYSRLLSDPSTLRGAYGMFAVTSDDDIRLMLWIKENLARDAVILVNKYEPGPFIPAVAHRKAIFATPGSQLSRSYQEVMGLLMNETLNASCYDIMRSFGITHVYFGSGATYQWVQNHKWNPQLFLGNPNFELVKRIGGAYLFKVLYKDPSNVFQDNFEHERWDEYGWQTYFDGNGVGNVTLVDAFGNHSQKCLKMTAQAVYTVSTWKYTRYILKQIFVQNNSDVSLSFYLNATKGFNGKDALAVLISNVYHNESIVITTPHGVYESYANNLSLSGYEGFFEFTGSHSLSALWRQLHNESLPNTFILEFVSYDFDGTQNVAYIDDITITSTSAG